MLKVKILLSTKIFKNYFRKKINYIFIFNIYIYILKKNFKKKKNLSFDCINTYSNLFFFINFNNLNVKFSFLKYYFSYSILLKKKKSLKNILKKKLLILDW